MGEEKRHQLSRGVERIDESGQENRDRRRRDRHGDEGRDKEERKAGIQTESLNSEPRRERRQTSQSVEIGRDRPHSSVENGGSSSSAPIPNHHDKDSAKRGERPLTTTVDNSSLPIRGRDHSSNRDASGSDRKSKTYPPHPSRQRDPSERRGRDSNTPIPKDKLAQSDGENVTVPLPSRSNRSHDPKPGRRDPSINRETENLKLGGLRGSKAAATEDREKRSGDVPASKLPLSFPRNRVKVGVLPKCYLPRKEEATRRLIVFGDVHGMPDAKERLLEHIEYKPATDHQIFGGDMITKGRKSKPSKNSTTKALITIEASKDVVRQARKDGASGVRGNHEDCVLNVKHERNGWQEFIDRDMDNQFNIQARKKLRTPDHRDSSDYDLYDALTREERQWLEDLPDILVLGKCGGHNNMVVVHAGLNPFVGLKDQRIIETMNIKSIDPVKSKMMPWFETWEDKQKNLPPSEQMTVMYGHESKKGLTKRKFSIGLDTGAQRTDKLNPDKYRTLTALVSYNIKNILRVRQCHTWGSIY
ncbi:hypothetical protein BOTNAR_0200g00120 [Botryotinia narcissicola]|uniref:Calcineurin-like phosphoesterase domain-containing protein n=1 Tax=Botryotinia narcissicola TaxID=278944 RepID=A0A4Z1I850_9HELO|nr:hypothetical protein BOTNAR_0200g00120 [Botryotinia narcissicola]